MENLANDTIIDNLVEAFQIAVQERELCDKIAEHYLEGYEYWRYCQEDAWDLVSEHFDALYQEIEKEFWNCEGHVTDINELADRVFARKK